MTIEPTVSDAEVEAAARAYLFALDIDPDLPHGLKPEGEIWWKVEAPRLRAALLAAARVRGAMPEAAVAWIDWAGGPCPIPGGMIFSFRRRSGEIAGGFGRPTEFFWGRYDKPLPSDIIAYRFVGPSSAAELRRPSSDVAREALAALEKGTP